MAAEAATVLKLCVEDMDCGACALKIENELKRLPGVGDVNVKVGPERLSFASEVLRCAAQGMTEPLTITDVTHGRFELRLLGPAAGNLLSRVCGLDFHETRFAQGHVAQTSVAKTHQLIIRADVANLPAYRLIGGRALGAYVWDTLMEAGRDLQLSPIGWLGLQRLT